MNDLDPAQRSDQQLAADLAAGDASAIGAVASRYSSDLYDFAIRITLDAAAAAGVLQDTLEHAQTDAASRSQFLGLRAWLLALVRDNALEALRQRGRANAEPAEAPTPISTSDAMFVSAQDGTDPELASWAWQAARGQRPRDYSLLDLALRRQIASEEIAELAGLSRTGIYGVTGRLRGAFEETFAATALFHRGREACPELDGLADQDDDLKPELRRDIARHAESCPNCRLTLNGLPLASDLFATIANVEVPGELAAQIEAMFSRDALADTVRSGDIAREQAAALQTLDLDAPVTTSQPLPLPGALGAAPEGMVDDDEPPELVMNDEDKFESDEDGGETEDDAEPAAGPATTEEQGRRPVPLRFTRGPGGSPPAPERIRFDRRDSFSDPGGSGGGLGGLLNTATGGRGVWFLALLLGIVLIAGYVGVAVGDSLSGGGGDSKGVSALPTRAGGGRSLACGSGPLTVDQGSSATLSLDPKALNGYQVTSVTVQAVSPAATAQSVVARTQGGTNVVFDALVAPGQAGRLDEYKLSLTLTRGNERIISDCTVVVRAPVPAGGVPATATRPAAATTPGTQTAGTPAVGTPTPVRTVTTPVPPPPGSTATRVP